MRALEICHAWVVYRMTMDKGKVGGNVVCEQREWDAIELANPGLHTLLHTGVKTEKDAERLATGTAGDNYRVRAGRYPLARPAAPMPPRSLPPAVRHLSRDPLRVAQAKIG